MSAALDSHLAAALSQVRESHLGQVSRAPPPSAALPGVPFCLLRVPPLACEL